MRPTLRLSIIVATLGPVMASGGSRMMAQSKPTVGELFEKLQSEKMADEATVQLRKLARSDTAAVGFDPGEVIPDGSGGMLAYFALGGQSGPPTIADIGPGGIVQQTINQLANFNPGDDMVLGDNNTAFVTDGYTVVAFNPSTPRTSWTYTSTGGYLYLVAATSGGGVTIRAAASCDSPSCRACEMGHGHAVEHRVTLGGEHGPVAGYSVEAAQADLERARTAVAEQAVGIARRHEFLARLK